MNYRIIEGSETMDLEAHSFHILRRCRSMKGFAAY